MEGDGYIYNAFKESLFENNIEGIIAYDDRELRLWEKAWQRIQEARGKEWEPRFVLVWPDTMMIKFNPGVEVDV